MKSKPFLIKDRIKSFSYAFKGIASLLKKEHNSRIHFSAAFIVIVLGFYFDISYIEWLSLVIVIALVIFAELINTAIERLADVVEPEWNNKIGEVKDYASGAVLITSIASIIVGLIIFAPKIKPLLSKWIN